MKKQFIFTILKVLATVVSGIGKRKKLFILIYHRVLEKPDFMRPGEVDKIAFAWQMELLSKYFNVLPLSDALQQLDADTLPPRAVSISFDDGYADNCTIALPILKKLNLTAVFFIANGFLNGGRMWNDTIIEAVRNYPQPELDLSGISLGRIDVSDSVKKTQASTYIIKTIKHLPQMQRDQYTAFIAAQSQNLPGDLMMTTDQVKELHENGMEIGGHTVNHPILAKLDADVVELEIKENKVFLERLLNTRLALFAYPNGKPIEDFLPEHRQIVKDVGYSAAVSTQWGTVDNGSDRWQLPRFTPWDSAPSMFMMRMIHLYLKH